MPTVVVLTYNRLSSLKRLLFSVSSLEPANATVNLRVCCDRPQKAEDVEGVQSTLDYLDSIVWTRGRKEVFQHATNVGIVGQWLDCWKPTDNSELALILEDDLQVSPKAFEWLLYEYKRYKSASNIAGFSLERQYRCLHSSCPKAYDLSLPAEVGVEYKYILSSSWGFLPVTEKWHRFRTWYAVHRARSHPEYVPGVADTLTNFWYRREMEEKNHTKNIWTTWFLDFCNRNSLFTVYYNDPRGRALATNWRENGAHFSNKWNVPLVPLIFDSFSREEVGIDLIPELDWNGQIKIRRSNKTVQ